MIDILKNWLLGFASNTFYKVIPFLVILLAGTIVIKIVMTIVTKALSKSRMEKAAAGLIRSVIRTVLYLLLGLMAASKLGFDVTGIIALASVLTLAVSLSVQDLLTNLIGGFTLLYTKPFRSGDFVEIAGQCGTVDEIGMTYTKLITPDNKVVSIPNRSVVAADITNFSATGTRRVDLTVSASYDEPTKKVIAALLEAAKVEGVLEDPAPFAAVEKYGDSAISYVLRVWCKQEAYWDVYFTVNEKIRQSFADNGVAMTYAHLNVHLDK